MALLMASIGLGCHNGASDQGPNSRVSTALGDEKAILVAHSDLETPRTEVANDSTPVIKGDFDGDGKTETATLAGNGFPIDSADCLTQCQCIVRFSDSRLPDLTVPRCYVGHLENEGDLNADGADEIGVLPDWFSECKQDYSVFTLRDGVWEMAFHTVQTHCKLPMDPSDLVIPIANRPGWVDLFLAAHDDEGYGVSRAYTSLRLSK